MKWKLWRDQGFAAFGESLTAYIDFRALPSGAIRCVGPFASSTMREATVKEAMRDLTVYLEENHLGDENFVLWGAYADFPQYKEHQIEILGSTCGYLPAPWLRSELLGDKESSVIREWSIGEGAVAHRSGLSFPHSQASLVDSAMFHPSTSERAVLKLCSIWQHLSGANQEMTSLPVLRWTPMDQPRFKLASR